MPVTPEDRKRFEQEGQRAALRSKVMEALLNKPPRNPEIITDGSFFPERWPDVAHPPLFEPMTEVIGSPELAQQVEALMQRYPNLRGFVKQVVQAPTPETIGDLLRAGHDPTSVMEAGLAGLHNRATGRVYVQPGSKGLNLGNTLAHEFAHAQGEDDDTAYPIGDQREKEMLMSMMEAAMRGKR